MDKGENQPNPHALKIRLSINYVMRESSLQWIATGVLLLILLSTCAWAQVTIPRVTESRVGFHGIDVFVSDDGSAIVEEKLFFNFFAGEAKQFEKDFVENTPSLFEWKEDYPFIKPHIGSEGQAKNVEFLLNRTASEEPTLTVTYDYPTGLVLQVNVEARGRSTRWKVSDVALVDFIESANIKIPSNTQINFHFPGNSVVDTSLLPQGVTVSNNVVTLTNMQTNSLRIEYLVFTPIADPIDLTEILQDLQESPFFIMVLVVMGVCGLYVALNKDQFSRKIEEYVIQHSEFRPPPKQDIDGDLEADGGASGRE